MFSNKFENIKRKWEHSDEELT